MTNVTKFAERYFSALENSEVEVIDQIEDDLGTAESEGYVDTSQYAISYDDGLATVLDKANDEVTKFCKDGDSWKLAIIEAPEDVSEVSEDIKEYATSIGDTLIMRVGDCDISYNVKTREVFCLDDPKVKWVTKPNISLKEFLEDAKRKLKGKKFSYDNPTEEIGMDEGREEGFSETSSDSKLEGIKSMSEKTQKLIARRKLEGSKNYSGLSGRTKKYLSGRLSATKKFSEITTEEQFREYAHSVMQQAHGDNYSDEVTDKVVSDLLSTDYESFGELIGRLTSGLGSTKTHSTYGSGKLAVQWKQSKDAQWDQDSDIFNSREEANAYKKAMREKYGLVGSEYPKARTVVIK